VRPAVPPAVVVVAVAAVAVLLLAVVAAARSGHGPVGGGPAVPSPAALAASPPPFSSGSTAPPAAPADVPGWVTVTLLTLAAIFGLAVLALIVRALVRLLRRLRLRSRTRVIQIPPDEQPVGPASDVSEQLRDRVAVAAEHLQEATGPPGDAVVRCWLELEGAAAATGAPRTPAQTPTEFTAGLLRQQLPDAAAPDLAHLLALYHRARFSDRPMAAADVETARRSLAALAAALGPARSGDPLPAPTGPDR